MVKPAYLVKQMREQEVKAKIRDELQRTFREIPFIVVKGPISEASLAGAKIDLVMDLRVKNRDLQVLVEVSSLGEPRVVRAAIQQLKEHISRVDNAYPIVAAPYISDDTAMVCRQNGVGYIDLAGNCLLSFDQIYVERRGYPKAAVEKRQVRSIFSPKSSRILRVMLDNPGRSWRVQELAGEAQVSLGLASRLKERLLDLEYALENGKGLALSRPGELLELWADNYSFRKNKVHDYFGFHEVGELERDLSQYCGRRSLRYALTMFSGAALVAPFMRYTRGFAYVVGDVREVSKSLGLKEVSSGHNFTILEPYDEGVFYGSRKVDGMTVVSNIQLYLDLVGFKGRGEESARFLLEQRIRPRW